MRYPRCLLTRISFILLLHAPLSAQPVLDSLSSSARKTPWILQRKTLVTAGVVGQTLFATYLGYKWWWEGNYHAFRYENDGFWHNYSLGVDKVGHFYTSYFFYKAIREVMVWGGYQPSDADLWGLGISLFYGVTVEIGDGFSTYAFSGVDLAANVLGAGYGYLQHSVPFLQNFKFKWSYYPSGKIPFDGDFRITDDYDGHIYWLSIDVHNLLPESWQSAWPKLLNLAVGYGGEDISGRPPWVNGTPIRAQGIPSRKWVIALDYNLSSLPTTTDTWTMLKHLADLFHYPAPAVRFVQHRKPIFKPFLLN